MKGPNEKVTNDGFERLLKVASANDGEDGWTFVERKEIVTISQRKSFNQSDNEQQPQTKVSCFRGQALLPFAPEDVLNLILDHETNSQWNPQLQQTTVLESISDSSKILLKVFRTKRCLIEISRDFVFLEQVKKIDSALCVLALSELADQTLAPQPQGSSVRGFVYVSGWVLQPWEVAGGKFHTNATYVTQVDLKELPQKILELAGKEQPYILHRLAKALEGGMRGKTKKL